MRHAICGRGYCARCIATVGLMAAGLVAITHATCRAVL